MAVDELKQAAAASDLNKRCDDLAKRTDDIEIQFKHTRDGLEDRDGLEELRQVVDELKQAHEKRSAAQSVGDDLQKLHQTMDELKQASTVSNASKRCDDLEKRCDDIQCQLKNASIGEGTERSQTVKVAGDGLEELRKAVDDLRQAAKRSDDIETQIKNVLAGEAEERTSIPNQAEEGLQELRHAFDELKQDQVAVSKDVRSVGKGLRTLQDAVGDLQQGATQASADVEQLAKLIAERLEAQQSKLDDLKRRTSAAQAGGDIEAETAMQGAWEDVRKASADFKERQTKINEAQAMVNAAFERRHKELEEALERTTAEVEEETTQMVDDVEGLRNAVQELKEMREPQSREMIDDLRKAVQELQRSRQTELSQVGGSRQDSDALRPADEKGRDDLSQKLHGLEDQVGVLVELMSKGAQSASIDLREAIQEIHRSREPEASELSKRCDELERRNDDIESQLKSACAHQSSERSIGPTIPLYGFEELREAVDELKQAAAASELNSRCDDLEKRSDNIESQLKTALTHPAFECSIAPKRDGEGAEELRNHVDEMKQAAAASDSNKQSDDLQMRGDDLETQLKKASTDSTSERSGAFKRGGGGFEELQKAIGELKETGEEKAVGFRKDIDALKRANENIRAGLLRQADVLEEQLGALDSATSDLNLKVDQCATKELVMRLRARVDAGLRLLIERLESDKWIRMNVDKTADMITNSFLRLVDESNQKLKDRFQNLEQGVFSSDAGMVYPS